MIPGDAGSPFWTAIGWTMLHFLWIGTLLGGLAILGRGLLRKAKAEARYIYGLLCLSILTITPFLIALRTLSATSIKEVRSTAASLESNSPSQDESTDLVTLKTPVRLPPTRASLPRDSSSVADNDRPVFVEDWPAVLALYLPYLWLVGTPITFGYLAVGLAGAERLRSRSALVVDPGLIDLGQRLAVSVRVARRVVLATCDRLSTPILVGILRPTILLPTAAITGWTPEQLEMALLHELAHVRRWDNLVLLIQRLVESTLFFHPAIWLVSGWVHHDREHCCDAAVVRQTGRPIAYAEALLALADIKQPSLGLTTVAMAEGDLVGRVRYLLNQEGPSMKLPGSTIALCAGLILMPLLLIGSRAAFSRSYEPPPKDEAKQDEAKQDEVSRKIANEIGQTLLESADKASFLSLVSSATSQAQIGNRDAALKTLREAARLTLEKKPAPQPANKATVPRSTKSGPLLTIGKAQAELGDNQEALETFRKALRAKGEPEGSFQRLNTLSQLANEFMKLKAVDDAKEVVIQAKREVDALKEPADKVKVLRFLAGAYVAAGDIDGAFALLDATVNKQTAKDDTGKFLMWMTLAAENADSAITRSVIDRAIPKLVDVPPTENYSSVFTNLASALAKVGDYPKAMEFARHLSKNSATMALNSIAKYQHQAGDIEGARKTLLESFEAAKLIEEARGKSHRITTVAMGMIREKDLASALGCVGDIAPGERLDILTQIAEAQRWAGDKGAADATFLRALEDAEFRKQHPPKAEANPSEPLAKIEDIQARWDALNFVYVAKIHAMMGHYDEARKMADSLPDPLHRQNVLYMIAQAQAEAGEAETAFEWIRKEPADISSRDLLNAILHGLANRAEAKKALKEGLPVEPKPKGL